MLSPAALLLLTVFEVLCNHNYQHRSPALQGKHCFTRTKYEICTYTSRQFRQVDLGLLISCVVLVIMVTRRSEGNLVTCTIYTAYSLEQKLNQYVIRLHQQ